MMSEVQSNRKRHCSQCVRRRLVCDSALPACKRCLASGTSCPGYTDYNDPSGLRWLELGRVVSRSPNKKRKLPEQTTTEPCYRSENANVHEVAVSRFEMKTDANDLFQAVEYFNTCIYADLVPLNELAPNPHIYLLSPAHLQIGLGGSIPDYLRLSLVCMTLSHRINRTRGYHDPHCGHLVKNFYQYRGILIRSLGEDINVEHKRTSDAVIAGIMTLLLIDVHQGTTPDWRFHLEGIQKLIMLRGGIRASARSQNLKQLVLYFVVITVISNTTSPATDLAMTNSHPEQLKFILEQDGDRSFPSEMCPVPLLAEIIKINHLRVRTADCIPTCLGDLPSEAYEILDAIDTFSPQQWANSKPSSKQDWMLMGSVYQKAVAIYCISSLQSLLSLLSSLQGSLRARCATHGQVLQTLLGEALACPRIKRFMVWPLVCLGIEAAEGNASMRTFVAQKLSEMSRHVGTHVPLTAKGVLERFWASGDTRWDACFDRPYAFATQIAIDISQVFPQENLARQHYASASYNSTQRLNGGQEEHDQRDTSLLLEKGRRAQIGI